MCVCKYTHMQMVEQGKGNADALFSQVEFFFFFFLIFFQGPAPRRRPVTLAAEPCSRPASGELTGRVLKGKCLTYKNVRTDGSLLHGDYFLSYSYWLSVLVWECRHR